MDNEKAARLGRLLFFAGSAACLVAMFAYLTPVTMAYIDKSNHMENGKGVPADVVRGKQAFHKFVCMDCHTILGDGTQYAPELGRVAIFRDAEFLKTYMKDPRRVNPDTGMPTMAMTDQEAADLVAFLEWTSKINLPEALHAEMKAAKDPYDPRAYDPKHNPFAASYWPPRPMSADKKAAAPAPANADPLVAEGARLFHDNPVSSCATCHQVGGDGGTIGPDLSDIGADGRQSRFGAPVDAKFLATKLVTPGVDSPAKTSAMPSYDKLTERQRKALVAYLGSLKR